MSSAEQAPHWLRRCVGGGNQVVNQQADQVADHAVALHVLQLGTSPIERGDQHFPQGDAAQRLGLEHARAQAVIQVVGGVGQLVGDVADLRLQVTAQVRVELAGIRDVVLRLVLDHALAHLPGEIQPGELGIALFQLGDDAQGLAVVIEAAEICHQPGKGVFAGMPEGGMSQVVRQADGLHQVFVGTQGAGDGAPDLRHFQRVGEAGAEVIALVVDEHLGLVFQAAEGGGMQHPVAVALKGGAVIGLGVQVGAALAVAAALPVGCKAAVFDLFQLLASVHAILFRL